MEISKGSIIGSGFDCELPKMVSGSGVGMEAYETTCRIDGKKIAATKELAATMEAKLLAFDLGYNPDHFELSIPGRDVCMPLHPRSPVPGLD